MSIISAASPDSTTQSGAPSPADSAVHVHVEGPHKPEPGPVLSAKPILSVHPQTHALTPTHSMGPLSAPVVLPPRPKPGRKPMAPDEAGGEKRKAQNRNAQRRFRDKRQQKLEDTLVVSEGLQRQLQDAALRHEQALQAVRRQNLAEVEALQRQIQSQQAEIAELKAQLAKAEQRRTSADVLPNVATATLTLPPIVNVAPASPPHETEIDFTNYGRPTMGDDDKCGFCGTGDTCPCAAAALPAPPPSRATGPGTCDLCRADPARAEACMALAASSSASPAPDTVPLLPANTRGRPTVPCGTVVDAFAHARAPPADIASLFGGRRVKAYAPAERDAGGFDLEHEAAAKVLLALNDRVVKHGAF